MRCFLATYDNFERLTTKEISLSTMANFYEDYAYYGYTATTEEGTENRTTSLVSSLTQRISTSSGNTSSAVYSYIYDNLGNITQIKKDGVLIESYEYDSLGQMTRANVLADNSSTFYQYDKAGNILYKFIKKQPIEITRNSIPYRYIFKRCSLEAIEGRVL